MSGRRTGLWRKLCAIIQRKGAPDPREVNESLVRRLGEYGRRDLSATDQTLRRIEGKALAAFRAQASSIPSDAAAEVLGPDRHHLVALPRRMVLGLPPVLRFRSVAAIVVVFVAGLGSATVVEGGPGQPLYDARLAVETMALPPRTSEDRVDAQLDRMRRRLSEAEGAVWRGDAAAVNDALQAYRGTLDEVVELARVHPAKVRLAVSSLAQDARTLDALADRVSFDAPAAIRDSLDRTRAAIVGLSPTRSQWLRGWTGGRRAPVTRSWSRYDPGHGRLGVFAEPVEQD